MSDRPHRFRRPAMLDPRSAEQIPGDLDPAVRSEIAYDTASVLIHRGRRTDDPQVVQRLLELVDSEGLDLIAALWSEMPAQTLPGTLWRLYLLREWVRRDPETVSLRYRLGIGPAQVHDVIAGVASPPGPDEVAALADDVLSGVFTGDLAVTLERAAAFCRVLATGAALDADQVEIADGDLADAITRRAGTMIDTAEELERSAGLWRSGRLD